MGDISKEHSSQKIYKKHFFLSLDWMYVKIIFVPIKPMQTAEFDF